ncbi:MAG: outer membrane protein chaperone [marine bacterium B5-7]|nr:MAG: outer membrane protein chaperone [marine bacterium B5-7]
MNTLFRTIISITATLALTTSLTYAEETYKIGAVNANRILQESPQAEAAIKMLEKEFSPRDKGLLAAQKKIKALEDKFNKDRAIMSEQERTKLEREVIAQQRDLKRDQDEFREDLNFRRNEEFGKIQKRVVVAIQKIAKENNYDVILGEGVIFASSKVDISGLVIDYLKKEVNAAP